MTHVSSETGCARAEFIARVTADATHEVRNVLAIVRESAGLVGDLMAAAGPDRAPDHDRVRTALDRIEGQVARGADLMTSLNRLAHGLDRGEEDVNLVETLRHLARLYRRYSRERGHGIQVSGSDEAVTVRGNVLDVCRSLARDLEANLKDLPDGETLLVTVEGNEDGATVRFGERATASLTLP